MTEETKEELTPGTPEYDEHMASVADGTVIDESTPGAEEDTETHELPEGVPEKFFNKKTGEVDHASWNKELLYREEQRNKNTEEESEEESAEDKSEEETEDKAKETLDDKGLDINDFNNEYLESGELSAASYKKLADAGIPEDMVDAYIEGQKALAEVRLNEYRDVAGGKEQYEAMMKWAETDAITKEERDEFNEQVLKDPVTVRNAITAMHAKYVKANGDVPNLLQGDEKANGADIFESQADFVAAMNDPRYGKDRAYTQSVEAKMKRTPEAVFS